MPSAAARRRGARGRGRRPLRERRRAAARPQARSRRSQPARARPRDRRPDPRARARRATRRRRRARGSASTSMRRCGACEVCASGSPFCPKMQLYGYTQGLDVRSGLHGGYGEYMEIMPNTNFVPLTESVPASQLSLFEPLANVVNWFGGCDLQPGESVVIQGPGHMGLICAAYAKMLGAGTVIVTGTRATTACGSKPRIEHRRRPHDRRRRRVADRTRRADHRRHDGRRRRRSHRRGSARRHVPRAGAPGRARAVGRAQEHEHR